MSDFSYQASQQKIIADSQSCKSKESRSGLTVAHSTEDLFESKTRKQLRAEMRQGYIEMASVNLAISNEFSAIESELSPTTDSLV